MGESTTAKIDKFDLSGNLLTSNNWYGNNFPYASAIAVDSSNPANVFILQATGQEVVEKYDANGNLEGAFEGVIPSSGNEASGLVVDPSTGCIFIGDSQDHLIEKYGPNGQFICTFGPPQFINEFMGLGMKMGPNGNIYVANAWADNVVVFSCGVTPSPVPTASSTPTLTPTITATQTPTPTLTAVPTASFVNIVCSQGNPLPVTGAEGVAVDGSGNVYVADDTNGVIDTFNSHGVPGPGIGAGYLSFPFGVAVDGNGNVYVTDLGSDSVYVFSNSGLLLTNFGGSGSTIGRLGSPAGIAVTVNGSVTQVYVVDSENLLVQDYQLGQNWTVQSATLLMAPAGFDYPIGVALDSGGNVFVTDSGTGLVQVFYNSGLPPSSWYATLNTPLATANFIAVGPNNLVYVSDGSNFVGVFTEAGVFVGAIQGVNQPLGGTEGVAVGVNSLYVADYVNDQVDEFGNCIGLPTPPPTGTFTPVFTATNTTTQSATITPTNTITLTPTPTNTGTPTASPTGTPSASPTNTVTNTPTNTYTFSNTPTNSYTITNTPSYTFTITSTPTNTYTVTNTPTNTNTISYTPTKTITASVTPSPTASWTVTATSSKTYTPTNTFTISYTPTKTNTASVTPSLTASWTVTATPSKTYTPSVTPTPTPTVICGISAAQLQLNVLTNYCGANQLQDFFEILNSGAPVTLSDITIKFWGYDTSGSNLVGAISTGGCLSNPGCFHNVTGVSITAQTFSPACGPGNRQANWEITVSNTDGTVLNSEVSWTNIQTALNLANYSNFSPGIGDWYSQCVGGSYTSDVHYALYLQGNLVSASGGIPPSCRPLPTCTPSGGSKARKMPDEISTPTQTPTITATAVPELVQTIEAVPNISTGQQSIQFRISLGRSAHVSLALYNIVGERVYNASLQGNPGLNSLEWGLQNNSGGQVASGLYIYVVQIGDGNSQQTKIGKVVVIK